MTEATVLSALHRLRLAGKHGLVEGNPAAAEISAAMEMLRGFAAYSDRVRVGSVAVGHWAQTLQGVCYDVVDLLDKRETALLKHKQQGINGSNDGRWSSGVLVLHNFFLLVSRLVPCSCITCNDEIGDRLNFSRELEDIRDELNRISKHAEFLSLSMTQPVSAERYSNSGTSFLDPTRVLGREEDKRTLIGMLLNEVVGSGAEETTPGLQIVSVVGMMGIGKTTLAQLVYIDPSVASHFERLIWVRVSQHFDEKYIVKKVIESKLPTNLKGTARYDSFLKMKTLLDSCNWQTLLELMHEAIEGKKFLFVLDDVWEEDLGKWQPIIAVLKSGSKGSRVLVTTCNQNVAHSLNSSNILSLRELSLANCWPIFKRKAVCNSHQNALYMEYIGRQIVERCGGVPLVAAALGDIVCTRYPRENWAHFTDHEICFVRGLLDFLWPTYFHLPPPLRLCFSYCAIFPKGFKIKDDKLIKLWMAQGYLNMEESGGVPEEVVGEKYIQNLNMRFLLKVSTKREDNVFGRRVLEMHDIVHDFAKLCSFDECFRAEVKRYRSLPPETRHLAFVPSEGFHFQKLYDSIHKHKCLHSLLIQSDRCLSSSEVRQEELSSFFTQMTLLRSLDLSNSAFKRLPSSISNLVLLRLLILSENRDLEELPEEIGELSNLLTLEVNWCEKLKMFPKGIGRLSSLRYLGNLLKSRMIYMPKGIGRLSCLRTLQVFNIGHDCESASLADLGNLNKLSGYLCVSGLGHVIDISEAYEAQLGRKEGITALEFNFQGEGEETRVVDNELLLEALHPHSNLVELTLRTYHGKKFPSWFSMLYNLRKISLFECDDCERFPSLGKLPCLEELVICFMPCVKMVGGEFLGMGVDGRSAESSSSVVAFPMLTKLTISHMPLWRVWSDWSHENAVAFPELRSLSLEDCPGLEVLPEKLLQITCLEELKISVCPLLEKHYSEGGGDWAKVAHVSNLKRYSDHMYTSSSLLFSKNMKKKKVMLVQPARDMLYLESVPI